jgi:hypothetical protein
VTALAAEGQPRGHEMAGIELGYRYDYSPVIAAEPDPVASTVREYRPSAAPGARLPHLWTGGGAAMHDLIGTGFTLLDLGEDACDASALAACMEAVGAPFTVLRVPEPRLLKAYERRRVLVRPDLHVAWRGDTLPEDCGALAALVVGHTAAGHHAKPVAIAAY